MNRSLPLLFALFLFALASCKTEGGAPVEPAPTTAPASDAAASPSPSTRVREEALNKLQAALEQEARENPNDANSFYNLGNVYFEQRKYPEAIEQYRRAVQKNPRDADALTRLGNAHAALGQFAEAVETYRRAVAADPEYAEARSQLAAAYERTGRAAEAERERLELLRLRPNEAGKKLITEGRAHEGIDALRKVGAKNAETHYLIGMGHFKLEQYGEAAGAFRAAVRLDPKYADAFFQLGNAHDRLKQYEEAAGAFAEVVRLTPTDADAYFNLGNAQRDLDRYKEATEAYERAFTLNPADADARLQFAALHLRHGNTAAAARQLEELKRLNPEAAARLDQLIKQTSKGKKE